MSTIVDRERLATLTAAERANFAASHPRSAQHFAEADHLFGQVPMTWMNKRATPFPIYFDHARGARITDVDGHEYVDFCLGDTGSMAGHSPPAVVAAVTERFSQLGGANTMLPSPEAEWVAAELAARFGLPRWSFSLTATDANRWVIRMVRAATGRPKILVNSYCYHGSVDESLIVATPDGAGRSREGNVGAPCDVTITSRAAEFNDIVGLERQLAEGDVAAVLMEPALTNIGIVLPDPGYHEEVRRLTRENGALLIIDETHSFSAGPGGATRAWGLDPDVITIGKAIAGGIPAGAYGMTKALSHELLSRTDLDLVDMGGVGGTLAGNALSIAAMKATLQDVLTESAFTHMIDLATRFTRGVQGHIDAAGLAWSITQLGARAEYRFAAPASRTGSEADAATDPGLDDYVHVFFANRGVLMTPFHNMALMCPATSAADVDKHTELFGEAVAALIG